MLKTSFVKVADSKNGEKFYQAVAYMSYKLQVEVLDPLVEKALKKKNGKDLTEEERKVYEKEYAELYKEREEASNKAASFLPVYERVVYEITSAGNSERAVKNCIAILATDCDRKKLQIAWSMSEDDAKKLKSALDTIHISGGFTACGAVSQTKAVKEAFKTAKGDIERVMKDEFSLPFETDYTRRFMCNCNASDLHAIHETYITGLRLKTSEISDELTGLENDESNWYTATTELVPSLQIQKRKGKTVMRNQKFCQTITMIVMSKYSK